MSETWPTSLPSFPLTEWGYKKKSSIIKTDMELGPAKRRRRTTAEGALISGVLSLSQAQFETFKTFVETTLNGGIEEIEWPDFISGETQIVSLDIGTNEELYSVKQTGVDAYEIGLKLEVKP